MPTGFAKKNWERPRFRGVYLLCLAAFKKMIPLEPETMLEAIKSSVAEKHLEINIKTFELAKKNANQK